MLPGETRDGVSKTSDAFPDVRPPRPFEIRLAGDSAVVMEFEPRVDPIVSAGVIAVADAIRVDGQVEVREVVSSYCSVTVYFDPLRTNLDQLMEALRRHATLGASCADVGGAPTVVPVCYGGDYGPDLREVAMFGGCSADEVVRLHADTVYRVYLLGFIPGFAYMGRVDERIAMPRRQTPRVSVPGGSVGIAGVQTGIYPTDAPGGWRLIGRTPIRPFDAARDAPFLFRPGDAVKFQPIDESTYREQEAAHAGHDRVPGEPR